jgi:hypothetical protein
VRHEGTRNHLLQTEVVDISSCIAFLSSLGSFLVGLDVMDYLLDLSDKVWTKDRHLARLDPVQRCMTSTAIQSFEGCHSETLLIIVVVRELSQQETLVLFVMIAQHARLEHIFKNLIHSLCLTIGLWMIC